ncbi:hypothetical protein W97_05134 [Coniosporium apollinis CBS 100218]|uniref:Uncharacterized protein n=1 Tax=Coniosporium apollinis (strain CBS 100218) TaxID=1168221 RepID=R7YVF9_CONA1|nr:uncharacterized protein W97_05134 [Coniosporium apollinis CBS 100218]EON65892.1 hypothetical protein W97_05134 [Coniosporium apollinis CBS 100218]
MERVTKKLEGILEEEGEKVSSPPSQQPPSQPPYQSPYPPIPQPTASTPTPGAEDGGVPPRPSWQVPNRSPYQSPYPPVPPSAASTPTLVPLPEYNRRISVYLCSNRHLTRRLHAAARTYGINADHILPPPPTDQPDASCMLIYMPFALSNDDAVVGLITGRVGDAVFSTPCSVSDRELLEGEDIGWHPMPEESPSHAHEWWYRRVARGLPDRFDDGNGEATPRAGSPVRQ